MKKVKSIIAILLVLTALSAVGAPVIAAALPFNDVSESAWYYEAVKWCYENGVVSGTSATTFSPSEKMTRASVIVMIWNLEKKPQSEKTWHFVDGGDAKNEWYAPALNWAFESGILAGIIRTNEYGVEYRYANPNVAINRGQLIAFLYRYMVSKGKADNKSNIYFATIFADYLGNNDWNNYKDAIAWATESRIIAGIEKYDDNENVIGICFAPSDTATRAEAVQLFKTVLTTELVASDGHIHHFNSFDPGASKDSTCTVRGHFTYKCAGCNERRVVTRALLNHDYYLIAEKAPSCTEAGSTSYVCRACGHKRVIHLAKLGHSFVKTATVASTYRKEGYVEYKCQRCGEVRRETLPKRTPTVYERVINRTYPIPANYISGFNLVLVENGQYMEANAASAMKNMLADLRKAGLPIIAQSGYRSDATQTAIHNNYVNTYGNKYKAATISAVPYTSEHQAGLAMDLSTNGQLEQWFESTAQYKWLYQHCAEYGYIVRYTKNKEKVTGIIYEPWHFRYVGSPEVAKDIMASGLCMEEYYGKTLAVQDINPYLPYLS